jgi:uncharacterized membrane protein
MDINNKTLGYLLIGFAALLLISLIVVKLDVDKQSTVLCEKFQETKTDMKFCPVHTSNVSWYITSGFALSFLVLLLGIMVLFFPKYSEGQKKDFKSIDTSKLNNDEKIVYESIKAKKGSAYQSDIIKETGFSKVKVTRILDRLETGEILERKRRGMTNLIILK